LGYKCEVFASVAVPAPLARAFSYAVPAEIVAKVVPGARVLCEFGRRKVMGVVVDTTEDEPDVERSRIKPLLAVIDSEPALPAELLEFLRELSRYYLSPIGDVLRLALPHVQRGQLQSLSEPLLAQAAGVKAVGRSVQTALSVSQQSQPQESQLRGQAVGVLSRLRESGERSLVELEQEFSNARSAVKRLVELELARLGTREVDLDPFWSQPVERDEPRVLNEEQRAAVDAITGALATRRAQTFLLHGVTGSGKTEVYLQAVEYALEADVGVIVLVPEIALTPQLVARFRARFGDQIAVLHSGLSPGERAKMWRSLREGRVSIAVGARSALFAPVRELGLLVVDEEHDASFKQEEGVRYHARDMALLRAHRAKAICVLGSATPSLSSEALVRKGSVQRLSLPRRAVAGSRLPDVEVVNLRSVGPGPTGHRLLSVRLHRELERVLQQKRQAILFLNRRGFAPSLVCESCGGVAECPNCSVALTMHKSRGEHLRCHYCDYQASSELRCPKCKVSRWSREGAGTERIEYALAEAFPDARIARLDRDVAAGLKSERILDRMRAGEVDILVGTQMVTKGHDLPNVSLVGVLNADAALSLPDYQASERTFSLLVQVAGRAGRADTPGKVLIQTRNPDHPAIRFATRHDFDGFVEQELDDRKEAHYPPHVRLLMVRIDSLDDRLAQQCAQRVAEIARRRCADGAEVLGPSPAPIERLRNRYRYRCIIRAEKRAPLYQAAAAIERLKPDRRVRISIDIDPVSML
jgi:primosomal protein N' (replication factor Y)